jgi:hypothetical protein
VFSVRSRTGLYDKDQLDNLSEISSVMTYTCLACELVADACLLKLQRLQNRALRTIGNFPRCTLVRDLQTVFSRPYVYDYIIKLCRQQTDVIENHENEYVRGIGQGEPNIKNIGGLNLEVVKLKTVQVTKLPL